MPSIDHRVAAGTAAAAVAALCLARRRREREPTLDEIAADPSAFELVVSGHHDHQDCNGSYAYDGVENGRPRFAKVPNALPKVFWTGGTWDLCWGGYSPEAPLDTPVPPASGYTSDQGGCDIKTWYVRKTIGTVMISAASRTLALFVPPIVPMAGAKVAGAITVVRSIGQPKGAWSEHRDIDMCGQGDVQIVHNWTATHTIEQLKKIVEEKGYSAITVSSGEPSFGHAALKTFSYQLTPEQCAPISTCCKHPCTIYIYTPPASRAKAPTPPAPPALPADPEAPRLVLVSKGSPSEAVFEHADALSKGEAFVPLTLKSGKAVVHQAPRASKVAHFQLIPPAIGAHSLAVYARLDADGCLTCKDNGFVFDVDHWKYEVENEMWMLQEGDDVSARQTRNPDGGRSFMVNLDGTMSPVKAPHLVLGAPVPQLVLVEKGSTRQCVLEHAAELKVGAAPLTLSSPGKNLAIIAKYEEPRAFDDYCEYIHLGLGPAASPSALRASYDDGAWIVREKITQTTTLEYGTRRGQVLPPSKKEYQMVFDVAFGKMHAGNQVNMLQRLGAEPSKEKGCKSREFTVNDNGTCSPTAAPDLVLGVDFVPEV